MLYLPHARSCTSASVQETSLDGSPRPPSQLPDSDSTCHAPRTQANSFPACNVSRAPTPQSAPTYASSQPARAAGGWSFPSSCISQTGKPAVDEQCQWTATGLEQLTSCLDLPQARGAPRELRGMGQRPKAVAATEAAAHSHDAYINNVLGNWSGHILTSEKKENNGMWYEFCAPQRSGIRKA